MSWGTQRDRGWLLDGGSGRPLLARRHPDRVRGLVLIATAAELARSPVRRGMGPLLLQLAGPLIRSGLPDRVMAELVGSGPAFLGELASVTPWLAGEMKRLHPADVVSAGKAIAAFDARPWLAELGTPAASIVTLRDRTVGPARQRSTAAALGAPVIEVDGGHAVCVTDPEVLGAAVRPGVDVVAGGRRDSRRTRTGRWLRAMGATPSAGSRPPTRWTAWTAWTAWPGSSSCRGPTRPRT